MSLQMSQRDLDYVLQQATELLGQRAVAAALDHGMETLLLKRARRVQTTGLSSPHAIRQWYSDSSGHNVAFGLRMFELKIADRTVKLVRLSNPFVDDYCNPLHDLWAAAPEDLPRVYKFLRQCARKAQRETAPVMTQDDHDKLWRNTIGYLERGQEAWKQFGVPVKRGVLLVGSPGNGKTMAARWLLSEANRHGYEWRTVTAEDYESARGRGEASYLFQLDKPGLVFFDDFDSALRHRDGNGSGGDHSTFLSELDGLESRQGVVYLFTSNANLRDLDPAIRRPGRIDVVIPFNTPTPELRRRMIQETWPQETVAAVDLEAVVAATDKLCFAEIGELKKLLVMRFLDENRWDWDWALATFRERMQEAEVKRPIGFVRPERDGHSHCTIVGEATH